MRRGLLIALLCGAVCVADAQEKKAAVTCATCHAGVVEHYSHAPMRHAMEPADANPVLMSHPTLEANFGGFHYTVQWKDGKSTYNVSDGTNTLTLPIHWAFGQHSQTWVLEKEGHMYESLVSYFPRLNGLGITPGDQKITPHSVNEAMGRELPIWETRTCFECHATNAVQGRNLTLDNLSTGLNCEHCHTGTEQHMADALQANFKTVPPHLRRMDAQQTSNFCGQCHRTWDTVVRNHWKGPAFVRFQPYRLQISKCFVATDKRIACIACHDPHQPVNHDLAAYNAKCMACHGEAKRPTAAAALRGRAALPMYKTCPVAKDRCVTCHMPKVDLPGGQAQFTDHFIRVVKSGEAYPD